ncbi:MAG: hypothetical protein KAU50_02450 [Candidatus Marinimicrobia bacterium]|nr:hypothetical protein [Candidatus Neomarinimicrobiota bacterium]
MADDKYKGMTQRDMLIKIHTGQETLNAEIIRLREEDKTLHGRITEQERRFSNIKIWMGGLSTLGTAIGTGIGAFFGFKTTGG